MYIGFRNTFFQEWILNCYPNFNFLQCLYCLTFLCFCKITTTFRGHFDGDKSHKSRETCISLLEVSSSRSFLLPASSVKCSGNIQTEVTVDTLTNTEMGNNCKEKLILINSEFGSICGKWPLNGIFLLKQSSDILDMPTNHICLLTVPCPAGRYFSTHTCNVCAEGLYQDLPDQSVCKTCGTNATSRSDGAACICMY